MVRNTNSSQLWVIPFFIYFFYRSRLVFHEDIYDSPIMSVLTPRSSDTC
jgi:hypothetical protein